MVLVVTEAVSLASVEARPSEVVATGLRMHDRVTITRHGRRAAVILSPGDFDALDQTLELLSDPAAQRDIAEGREAAARREELDAEAVRERYLRCRR